MCDVPCFKGDVVARLRHATPSDEEIENARVVFTALADRTRLKLLHALNGREELAQALSAIRGLLRPTEYDCLGRSVCYPAIAANAFSEACPSEGEALDLCPTEAPAERRGWPPLPGHYHVLRYRAPVATCTLGSKALAARIAERAWEGVSDIQVPAIVATEPRRLVPDPSGFFVVYPDLARRRLIIEHYTKQDVLDCVMEGATPAALYSEAADRGLLSRLDHAAYLGRELVRADRSIETGVPCVQDRAAGEIAIGPIDASPTCCNCGPTCSTGEST
ncbi:MAG: hypothetical protein L6R30_12640 [Thermoanaerobaculia bacterium]|nr:hypothetical protein [Thermoanaerobaculia bacterium]